MNKLFFILVFVFSFNFCFSQTSTERWNDYKKQYEYFDSKGNMTAYKVYNSYKRQWETFTVQSNNYRPLTLPDTQLIRETLSTLQARYDYNSNKIQTYIVKCRESLDSSKMDSKLIQNIKDSFNLNYLTPYYNEGYDLSSNTMTNQIIEWLQKGFLSTIKFEGDKFKSQTIKPETKNYTSTHNLVGGYQVPVVIEQTLKNGQWVTVKTENNNAFLFFDSDMLWFKRGTMNWLARKQTFRLHSSETKSYIYDSSDGMTTIDDAFMFVIFYDEQNSTKRYFYFIGNRDTSIIPK